MKYMLPIMLLAAIIPSVMAAVPHKFRGSPNPNSVDMGCVVRHCPLSMAKAIIDPVFMEMAWCQNSCNPYYYNDTTPMKLHYQNCTTKCALTYDSKPGDLFLGCTMENQCVNFGQINSTCPKPTPGLKTQLSDLDGEWWQQYGKNPLWDCYDCQHIHGMKVVNDPEWCGKTVGPDGPVKAPCFSYTYSYDLYLNKGTKYFEQTWQLPNFPQGDPIEIYYSYMGSTHNETWYLLDSTDNYVILVDCSYMSGWTNVGSILWVRPHYVLNDSEMASIKKVYKAKMNWNFPEEFCNDVHGTSQCTEPKLGEGGRRHIHHEQSTEQELLNSLFLQSS